MQPMRRIPIAEQTAAHLRQGLRRQVWSGTLPGVMQLAATLQVSRNTVEAALRQLETEGLLVAGGPGRKRSIASSKTAAPRHSLRVALLMHSIPEDLQLGYMVGLQHSLEEAGHVAFFAKKSQVELRHDIRRISRFVAATPADAWVVSAGTREVLEWFAAQTVPSIALFGRKTGVSIASAGPDKVPAYAAATRELLRLGHRRIVLLCRKLRRLPQPGRIENAFLAELAAHGVQPGPYNMPDWDESADGFQAILRSLFHVTPPTALIIDEAHAFAAAQQFLARRKILVPEQVSLVCTDDDITFAWCQPTVAHMRWDSRPVIRRIVRWAAAVSHGRADLKQTLSPAEFVRGGTIGPVGGK